MADVGYVRVSAVDKNAARQLERVALDKVFEDAAGGSTRSRPGLKACMDHLREGDTLHVHSMDRLAGNLADLLRIVRDLTGRGVTVRFHGEGLIFGGGDSPMRKLLFQVVGACAEFERALIRERQREGQLKARQMGKHCGRPRTFSPQEQREIMKRLRNGEPPSRIAGERHVTTSCIYKLRKRLADEESGQEAEHDGAPGGRE